MSAVATVLHEQGETVTGSDKDRSSYSEKLEKLGIGINYVHRAENVSGADVVLASAAIPDDNVELAAARAAGIPVRYRDEIWPELMKGRKTIAVAGTHGKTTTTALIAWILDRAGLSPGFIVGGEVLDLDTNARAGAGPHFVVEADEYRHAFLGLHPELAVVTNMELDHPDLFEDESDLKKAFEAFVAQVREELILCADDPGSASLTKSGLRRITYGIDSEADWTAEEIRPNGAGGSDFLIVSGGETLGLVRTRLPGAHNVRNALAALATAEGLGIELNLAREALTEFRGVARRFELIGEAGGITVIDDYAHHPTEIRATLGAARERYPDSRIYAVFQPHTYSRIRRFLPQFNQAFARADRVLVTEIFASREAVDPEISARGLASSIEHGSVTYVESFVKAAEILLAEVEPGGIVITLSAGDGNRVGQLLLEGLSKREGSSHE
jgi:UDP-N-acetylmuramate--alanine ligase